MNYNKNNYRFIQKKSNMIGSLIEKEYKRQMGGIELIASENYCSDAIMAALGSCLTWKYSEGYPDIERTGRRGRYYGGCQYIDEIEQYCCDKWQEVFNTNYHVNVQPHSGSQANMAMYAAFLSPGDTILSMSMDSGGHLTHSSPVSFVSKTYNVITYGLTDNGIIDYNSVYDLAKQYKPKAILAGASAYSHEINYKLFSEIANNFGAYFFVDMAHIAGLISSNLLQSPFGLADCITTTTHKILRGPRGGLIFCKPEYANKVDSAIFPYCQGGPSQNIIAAKAICAEEDLTEEYHSYCINVINNAKAMAKRFIINGIPVVGEGTDNHMFLLDLSKTKWSGYEAQKRLENYGITVNKNSIPNDKKSFKDTSGIRIGTPAMTTRGFEEDSFNMTADIISEILL